jgi:hypothetical protein
MSTSIFSEFSSAIQRHATFNKTKKVAAVLMLASIVPCHAHAATIDSIGGTHYDFALQTSVATRHFHPSSTQNNHQDLLNLEWNYKDDYLVGAATFKNTFEQTTELVYWGKKFRPVDANQDLYIKVVGGLIHGYKDEYKNKIPFNKYGTAPAILPSVGYCYKQVCSELIVFGAAGAMLTAGVRF